MDADDLVRAVRAALDETERIADVEGDGHWSCPSTGVLELGGVDDLDGLMTGPRSVVYHMARHDPAAVLRLVAADRRVLDRHQPVADHGRFSGEGCPPGCHGDHSEPVCKTCRDYAGDPLTSPCDEILDLADQLGINPEET